MLTDAKMPKRKCTLTDILKKEYPFLAESDNGKVQCTVCRAHFSIEHSGRSDIAQHISKKKQLPQKLIVIN